MNESVKNVLEADPKVKLSVRDIVPGMRFGKIVTIKRLPNSRPGKRIWLCRCDCGKEWAVPACPLVRGNTKSCGCRPNFEKFWDLLDKSVEGGCWVWTKGKSSDGYGNVLAFGRNTGTHRVAWILSNGPIPEGMLVLHSCDNPPCCNPAHLFLGTDMDNTLDKCAKNRQARNRGENGTKAKLNELQVIELRARASNGERPAHLAKHYGISDTATHAIINRKNWAHVK